MKHPLIFTFFLLIPSVIYGQDIPDPMSPPRLVNDFAGIYDTSERDELEQMLRTYNDTTSTQIYVVTVKDLGGYDISDYAVRLGEKWGIGMKGKDNGAVILIEPKVGNGRGRVFIATGYGLEPTLTDARTGRIIQQYMLPYFRQDDYYGGTKSAIQVIIALLAGQFLPEEEQAEDETFQWIIVAIIFMVIIIYAYRKSKHGGNDNNSPGNFPPIFPTTRGRGFGSGSGGGSVFRGGGGGRFGGGGAGRSW